MEGNTLTFALSISGIGIIVLLLVLALLAVVVSLMTRFIVDKPENNEKVEEAQEAAAAIPEKDNELEKIAVITLALARAQSETLSVQSLSPAGEPNSWRQFNLQKRLTQSSTIRRSR